MTCPKLLLLRRGKKAKQDDDATSEIHGPPNQNREEAKKAYNKQATTARNIVCRKEAMVRESAFGLFLCTRTVDVK